MEDYISQIHINTFFLIYITINIFQFFTSGYTLLIYSKHKRMYSTMVPILGSVSVRPWLLPMPSVSSYALFLTLHCLLMIQMETLLADKIRIFFLENRLLASISPNSKFLLLKRSRSISEEGGFEPGLPQHQNVKTKSVAWLVHYTTVLGLFYKCFFVLGRLCGTWHGIATQQN